MEMWLKDGWKNGWKGTDPKLISEDWQMQVHSFHNKTIAWHGNKGLDTPMVIEGKNKGASNGYGNDLERNKVA
jgi:hypothetical protein